MLFTSRKATFNIRRFLQRCIPYFPYIVASWFFNKIGEAYRISDGAGSNGKLAYRYNLYSYNEYDTLRSGG